MAHHSITDGQKRLSEKDVQDKEVLVDALLIGHASCLDGGHVVASPAPHIREATQEIPAKVLYQTWQK
jgi:hypothetical protein